jgi:molybdopterin-guanine dinucleotide biosynthesis protein
VNLLDKIERPLIVGVGGFTSQVGKTTLLCDLLQAFPGWEAIKTTRGHYRSCGKDPHACCVSHLLRDEPVVRSGRGQTYTAGKDTGRYWDSGAANVHWVIATDEQVEAGIKIALDRVQAAGVFVEGNSFTKFIEPHYFVMVVRPDHMKIKSTAKEALSRVSAFYLSGIAGVGDKESLNVFLARQGAASDTAEPAVFTGDCLVNLAESISAQNSSVARQFRTNNTARAAS